MDFSLAGKVFAWGVVALIAMVSPFAGEGFFRAVEKLIRHVARRRLIACLTAGLAVLIARAVLLPFWPVPQPIIYDESGYILGADTFAHGRLTNPTPRFAEFFEAAYILQKPTYASKYPPGQSLVMAGGQAIFGDPWAGVWLSCGIMMALLVWALQGWLPPGWALFGGFLALPLALVSYWMNSYWGGAVAAMGGALLIGGYARVIRQRQPSFALAMGVGLIILANTRPFEGLIFSIPVMIAFFLARPGVKAIILICAVLVPGFAAMGYYNKAVTGNPFRMPFIEYANQYAEIPLFNFQPLQSAKTEPTPVMRDLHQNWETGQWREARSWKLISMRLKDWRAISSTILGGVAMGLLLIAFIPALGRDRRIRLPLVCLFTTFAASWIEIRYYEHYAAPATAVLLILLVQAFRHLRHWKPGGRSAGIFLSRAIPLLVVGSLFAAQLVLILHGRTDGSQGRNAQRDRLIAALLDGSSAQHIVFVRDTGSQSPHEEWVYNSADIDSQDVIWALDLGKEKNAALIDYYKGRKVWLLQPDIDATHLDVYQ